MNVEQITLTDVLFLDIETVPLFADYQSLSAEEKHLWEEKTRYRRQQGISAQEFYPQAGIWAEFGKIVCLSVGYFHFVKQKRQFRVRSFVGEEAQILQDFSDLVNKHFSQKRHLLAAHNGKEFDFPYIARRMIINQIKLPSLLNIYGKKPWEVNHIDTMELWRFGDYKHYTPLSLLLYVLQIPTSKNDIDGSQVRDVFYQENDILRIAHYCEKDVVAVAQVLLRLRREPILTEKEILHIS